MRRGLFSEELTFLKEKSTGKQEIVASHKVLLVEGQRDFLWVRPV